MSENPVLPREGRVTHSADIAKLANALSKIHGTVDIRHETSGIHLYFASPACLAQFGRGELFKKHLALNADKYFGTGKYKGRFGTYDNDLSALCMKLHKAFKVSTLLSMPPLDARGYPDAVSAVREGKPKRLVDDGFGHMVPEPPGKVISIIDLPEDHVAVSYLRQRGFMDLHRLWHQMACCYCVEELPEDKTLGRYYRKLPGGFKATPQGRLIFFAFINGIRKSWQARLIDYVDDKKIRWVLHPYTGMFTPVTQDNVPFANMVDAVRDVSITEIPKYLNASGSSRNEVLFGYDAAVRYAAEHRLRSCALVEGPLDAAKAGPPCIAVTGKFFSDQQAALIRAKFSHVLYIPDSDAAGSMATEYVRKQLATYVDFDILPVPYSCKDMGEAEESYATTYVKQRLQPLI
jgi:hypothetical protein